MTLIKDRKMRKLNRSMLRQKSMQYTHLAGTPHQSEEEEDFTPNNTSPPITVGDGSFPLSTISTSSPAALPTQEFTDPEPSPSLARRVSATPHQPAPLQTRLAMSSMISYFNDRIL